MEAEKNSFPRIANLNSNSILTSFRFLGYVPNLLTLGDWIPVENFNLSLAKLYASHLQISSLFNGFINTD